MAIGVDLWLWRLDCPDAETEGFRTHLTPDETDRADRFVRPRDRSRFITGRGRMREILAGYMSLAPADVRFGTVAREKPVLLDGPAFNLSHSDGWAALCVAPGFSDAALPLGIDIEAFRDVESDLANRVFSPRECAALADLSQTARATGFFRGWTRKEAVIKALGLGLYAPLDQFSVSLGQAPVMDQCSAAFPPAQDWRFLHLDLGPRMVGALAAVTGGQTLQITLREGQIPLR